MPNLSQDRFGSSFLVATSNAEPTARQERPEGVNADFNSRQFRVARHGLPVLHPVA
jgi:hypothetical protein